MSARKRKAPARQTSRKKAAARRATPRSAKRTGRPGRGRRLVRLLGVVVAVVGLAAAWVWQRTLPLERVEVSGTHRAQDADVTRLAGVAPDSAAPVALYGIDAALVEDRVRRHPWVREVSLRRLPTGTLRLRVEERTPAALVVDRAGAPSHYLDAAGYAMPLPDGPDRADVPLLRGAIPVYHPTQPVGGPLRELLGALASADDNVDALVSEVRWDRRGATVLTTATSGHGPIPVRLGRHGHAERLRRLGAFWAQAVLPRPSTPFQLVDLRFDGQVVTRESAPSGATTAPDSLTASRRPAEAPPSRRDASLTP